jgi:tRNA (guanine9-N1)-methyltransferase
MDVQASSTTTVDVPLATTALTKNALKKAAKKERYEASKLERRAKEKEAKKAKKRALAQKRDAGELDSEDEAKIEAQRRLKRARTEAREPFNARVVIDLGFDDMMAEKVHGAYSLPWIVELI